MTAGKRFLVFRLPLLVYLALVFSISSRPVTSPELHKIPDYYLHAAEYCVMYVLMFRAFHLGWVPTPGRGRYWLPAILTILYGISDEFHQSFVPDRDASLGDAVADAVGALIGIPVVLLAARIISTFRVSRTS